MNTDRSPTYLSPLPPSRPSPLAPLARRPFEAVAMCVTTGVGVTASVAVGTAVAVGMAVTVWLSRGYGREVLPGPPPGAVHPPQKPGGCP